MKVKRWIVAAACVPLLLATMAGCPDQSSPKRISDGATPISKNMVGSWNAPGGKSCRWWVVSSSGSITNNGNTRASSRGRVQKSGPAADQSQTVILGTGNVGQTLRSDACGGWKR